jgi:hypothetical protein
MKKSILTGLLMGGLGILSADAASLYIGDVAASGLAVPAGTVGPDGANDGDVTYAFFSADDTYTNNSGAPQDLIITEVNFFSINAGTLTPFVAKLNGAGGAGASYDVLAVGTGISGVPDLNNAAFTVAGTNPTVTLANGETLVAGFHQTGGPGMIAWESPDPSDGDYLTQGNAIPAGGTGALTADTGWSDLGREYRFNVGAEIVPEPSTSLLLIPGLTGLLLFGRRRK